MATENSFKDIRSSIVFRSASKNASSGDSATPSQPKSFSLKDYKWVEKYQMNGSDDLHLNEAVPKLILVERQPIKKPDWSKIVSSLQAIDSIPGISQLLQTSLSPINSVSQAVGSNFLNSKADEYSSSTTKADELLDISDLEKLIEGPVVATYEIPFFNETYLRSNNRDGWSIGSAMDNAGQFTDIVNDGFQLNILKTPQWQNQSNDGLDWEVEFYLINDDLDSLQKNFQFIHALFPSTQWVRMKADSISGALAEADKKIGESLPVYKTLLETTENGVLQKAGETVDDFLAFTKSPNVFRVECPGRFLQLFVALDMEVSYVGNVRQMPLGTKIFNVPLVNSDVLYPDAYRVRLSARDLTPNCYNVYANYLMSQEIVTVDANTQSLSPKDRTFTNNTLG
jgi:hypothetical protein